MAMRRSDLVIGAVGVLCALLMGGLHIPDWNPEAPPVYGDRPPNRQEILRRIGRGELHPGSKRAEQFAMMLTERYRNQGYPVRVIVRKEGVLHVLCGANMSRRQMATVAVQVHADLAEVAGSVMPLIVFETYAAGPKRRIGELVRDAGTGAYRMEFRSGPILSKE